MGGWVRQSILFFTFLSICLAAQGGICTFYAARLAHSLMSEPRVFWKSQYLSSVPFNALPKDKAKARAREIIAAIYEPKSAIGLELDREFASRQREGSAWLNDYYRSYEIFYFSPRYIRLASAIHDNLPQVGAFVDLGSSTGGMSGILADSAPGRRMTLVDHKRAMTLSRDRMGALFPGKEGRFTHVDLYLGPKSELPGEEMYDGAVINHALYPLGPNTKLAALRALQKRLKPGATLVINEPLKEVATLPGRHREWLTEVIEDAVTEGSPHTEFDIAVLTAMCSGRMTQITQLGSIMLPMLTENEHDALFASVGWKTIKKETTYDGFSRMWVLKTP